jgi:hypothetical protein
LIIFPAQFLITHTNDKKRGAIRFRRVGDALLPLWQKGNRCKLLVVKTAGRPR